MTTISGTSPLTLSALSAWGVAETSSSELSTSTSTSSPAPVPSTIVMLGAGDVAANTADTYRIARSAAPAKTVWEHDSQDVISAMMAQNFQADTLRGRLDGLGASLLQRVGSDGSSFAQKVALAVPKTLDSTRLSVSSGVLHLKTRGGAEVTVTVRNQDDSLAVDIRTEGALSDSERTAITALAPGFQQALDGMARVPPKLDLSGLLQGDTQSFSAVDFQMDLKPAGTQDTQYALHIDQETRRLSVEGASGKMQLAVDTRQAMQWGDTAQQARSIATYLQQFDQAAQRGQDETELTALLKDGFSQLNRQTPTTQGQGGVSLWRAEDHALLSGLADFTASIDAEPTHPNPKRYDEVKTFSYQASQHTEIDDRMPTERHVVQTQQTHLSARYHTAVPGKGLDFRAGTYVYNQVEDATQSRTEFAYQRAQLVQATLQQSASQLTQQQTYEKGHKVSEHSTPAQRQRALNLLPLLIPDVGQEGTKTAAEREALHARRLVQVHALVQQPLSPQALADAMQKGLERADGDSATGAATQAAQPA